MLKKILISLFLSSAVMLSFSQSAFAMRQPAMERTLQVLQNAERALRRARPNKGGHRYRALRHIEQAIDEVREGIAYANRRPAGGQLKQRKRMERNPEPRMEQRVPRDRRNQSGEREYTEQEDYEKEKKYLKRRYE